MKISDADHLRDLQQGLKTSVPVTLYSGQRDVAKSILYDRALTKTLAKWGIVPNKMLTMPWPLDLPSTAIPAYIRGYFDGDGTIFHRHRSAPGTTWTETICRFISGSVPFLEGLHPRDAQRAALSAKGASQARSMLALFTGKGSEISLPYGSRRVRKDAFKPDY